MKLKMTINKIKSIDSLTIEMPVEKGLYALTGQNGAGKSTIATCASSVFFNMTMKDYFGETSADSKIEFEYNNAKKIYHKVHGKWVSKKMGHLELKGFYEGSLIFGNRFRNTSYNNLRKLDRISSSLLKLAPDFIRENLGLILHNNKNFYEKLFSVNPGSIRHIGNFYGDIFYYEIKGKIVSQFHMSTGENLLISILNSLNIRNSDRTSLNIPCILLLDEIELALHPSSLKRLVNFLKEISNRFNYAVYFSTHSLELISSIKPDNIYFLNRHSDHSLELINPCYPAYATRMLYDHTGYDYIILVEDDLAREIIKRLLKQNSLWGNKLIYILPCGGFTNVIDLAQEVISSNLVGKISNISIILDADVKAQANNYITKNNISNNIPLNYLPIESLEKYMKSKLFDNVDHKLFRQLNDFIFHQVSLNHIIDDYRNSNENTKDTNGKKLYERIDRELRARNKSRAEIIEMIVEYLTIYDQDKVEKITAFLKKQLE
ncbi:TPA: ATP-binding protein [Elizabethkingia anophelis]|uniref:ATP-dependent nuclease n=1 Tax=Elizabethkingia anophelis TaxID=1117645 RepID=UPI001A1BD074|nr:ATP-binding protein [Elizabethkingia anophelis]MCT4327354.1 ATP-binding protein [Elizabethkingia anophelis]HAT4001296.1 ATP-binding protein [Elizabethkingia anophelis]HAT4012532.1 ATP-binding protein [Elizabethkingia anophelis]HAY3502682.1 ATP-binding protein [Elizabethkingia anophelis]